MPASVFIWRLIETEATIQIIDQDADFKDTLILLNEDNLIADRCPFS